VFFKSHSALTKVCGVCKNVHCGSDVWCREGSGVDRMVVFLVPSVFVLLVFVEVFGIPNAIWVCLNVFECCLIG